LNFDPNFKKDCMLKFNKYGTVFFNQSQRLFRRLPLATVIENKIGFRLFVCHGGLSDRVDLNYIAGHLNRFQFASVTYRGNKIEAEERSAFDERKRRAVEQLSDLLWSDPITAQQRLPSLKGCYPNTNRNIGKLFGEDVSATFCKKYNFNAIIRSHEVRPNGI
jgi:diadenosine tetraphosphatase ApaH/serine/threonine PP2A family protein phosphatase